MSSAEYTSVEERPGTAACQTHAGRRLIQGGDDSLEHAVPTNFSVLRVRRSILRRSAVGAIFTRRSESTVGPGANLAWGLDANLSFYQHVNFGGHLAQSRTEGVDGDTRSYRGQFSYDAVRVRQRQHQQNAGLDVTAG